jgi:UDP-N-acetylglucosamine acyltransferase
MLRGSHVGHDCLIGDKTTLSCNVLIGGHSIVQEDVNFGLGAICHQFSVIGGGSMIGMGAIITKSSNVTPFGVYVGNPAKYLKLNTHKLKNVNMFTHQNYSNMHKTSLENMEKIKLEIANKK